MAEFGRRIGLKIRWPKVMRVRVPLFPISVGKSTCTKQLMLYNYKKYTETLNFFDLTEDKKIDMYYFVNENIRNILKNFANIIPNSFELLHIYADEYFFKFPNKVYKNFNEETINISLYVPVEILNKKTDSIKIFDLFICNLPLLLNDNSFWINGIPKVIHQQIAFDPVIFIDPKNLEDIHAILYDEKQERNLQLSLDNDNNISLNKLEHRMSEALLNFFSVKAKPSSADLLLKLDLLDSFRISEKIRYKLNKKFKIEVPNNILYLTKIDILKIKELVLKSKNYENLIPDLDDLENKTIKYLNDYFTNIIYYNLSFLEDLTKIEVEEKCTVAQLINKIRQNNISFELDELFSNSDVSLPIDEINPLTTLAQQRKFLNLKKQEGNENISLDIRSIHSSNFGRLCPIDTPEGGSAGLITSLTTLALSNKYGLLETPLFFTKSDREVINEKITYYDSTSEELKVVKFSIDQINFFSTNSRRNIKVDKDFSETKTNNVDSSFLSYLQLFSIACSNIPFLEHNDGNRILMGANMQKQAVPLLFPEKTIVSSGIEDAIASASNVVKSLSKGNIVYSDSNKIIVQTSNNKKLIYFLDKFKPTFNETIRNNTNAYWVGETVMFGQILSNGFSVNSSELALGTNLTVAYMNWDGFNFEDAIVISDRLLKNDKLTSLHAKTISVEITDTEGILFINNSILPYIKTNKLSNFGLITKNRNIKTGDVILVKEEKSEKNSTSNDRKLVFVESDFDGYISNAEIKIPETDSTTNLKIEYHSKFFKLDLLQIRKIQVGDKLSGRFGNKGVISKIIPEIDMPFLLDGTPVDILLNPLGIPSRMNVGQIFETLLGFIGTNLHTRYKLLSFDECFGKHASKILVNQKLKESKFKVKKGYSFINDNNDKNYVLDGRSGEVMDNPVLVGRTYILKLFHLVQDKITSRTIGPNSLITNQPLKGKKLKGGQRFGEMEVWALEAYGASYTLNEMLTLKSDDIFMNEKLLKILESDLVIDQINYSKALFILDLDLKSLGFDLNLNTNDFVQNSSHSDDILNEFKRQDFFMAATKLLKNIYPYYGKQ